MRRRSSDYNLLVADVFKLEQVGYSLASKFLGLSEETEVKGIFCDLAS
jgi:hypothetical protein